MKKLLFAILITVSATAFAQNQFPLMEMRPISVQGNAQMSVKPTETIISLSLKSTQSTYAGAIEDLIVRMDEMIKVLKDLKFKEEEIITSNFSVTPQYSYHQGESKEIGFIATQNLSIRFAMDKKRLLDVLNKTTASKAQPTINLSFDISDEAKAQIKAELIKMSVRDARAKADLIAGEAQYKVHSIKEIHYGQSPVRGGEIYMMADNIELKRSSGGFSNFEAADLTFSDGVTIEYYIVPISK